jgi:arylsulfatase
MMKRVTGAIFAPLIVLLLLAARPAGAQAQDLSMDRTVLPVQQPAYPAITELDARKATPPPLFQVKAPQGAPNVVVILLDNLGFSATKPFGGVINMPTL